MKNDKRRPKRASRRRGPARVGKFGKFTSLTVRGGSSKSAREVAASVLYSEAGASAFMGLAGNFEDQADPPKLAKGRKKHVVGYVTVRRRVKFRSLVKTSDNANEIEVEAAAPSPRANSLLRGRRFAKRALSRSGGGFNAEEVREMLGGVSEGTLNSTIEAGKLFFVAGDGEGRLFPAIQFTDGGKLIEGLGDVLEALPTSNGWARLSFLSNRNYDLDGEAPVGLLLAGDIGRVKAAASMYL